MAHISHYGRSKVTRADVRKKRKRRANNSMYIQGEGYISELSARFARNNRITTIFGNLPCCNEGILRRVLQRDDLCDKLCKCDINQPSTSHEIPFTDLCPFDNLNAKQLFLESLLERLAFTKNRSGEQQTYGTKKFWQELLKDFNKFYNNECGGENLYAETMGAQGRGGESAVSTKGEDQLKKLLRNNVTADGDHTQSRDKMCNSSFRSNSDYLNSSRNKRRKRNTDSESVHHLEGGPKWLLPSPQLKTDIHDLQTIMQEHSSARDRYFKRVRYHQPFDRTKRWTFVAYDPLEEELDLLLVLSQPNMEKRFQHWSKRTIEAIIESKLVRRKMLSDNELDRIQKALLEALNYAEEEVRTRSKQYELKHDDYDRKKSIRKLSALMLNAVHRSRTHAKRFRSTRSSRYM